MKKINLLLVLNIAIILLIGCKNPATNPTVTVENLLKKHEGVYEYGFTRYKIKQEKMYVLTYNVQTWQQINNIKVKDDSIIVEDNNLYYKINFDENGNLNRTISYIYPKKIYSDDINNYYKLDGINVDANYSGNYIHYEDNSKVEIKIDNQGNIYLSKDSYKVDKITAIKINNNTFVFETTRYSTTPGATDIVRKYEIVLEDGRLLVFIKDKDKYDVENFNKYLLIETHEGKYYEQNTQNLKFSIDSEGYVKDETDKDLTYKSRLTNQTDLGILNFATVIFAQDGNTAEFKPKTGQPITLEKK